MNIFRKSSKFEFDGYLMAACDDCSDKAVYKVKVLSQNKEYAVIQYSNGKTEEVPLQEFLPIDLASESGVSDLVHINSLNDASVLVNLESRFCDKQIFAFLNTFVVCINPFDEVKEVYNKFIREKYRALIINTPHVYKTAALAYNKLSKNSQVIVTLGQSGSGKTFTANKLVKFITEDSLFYRKIKAANIIFQAFGNAGSFTNENSTRYASFTKIFIKEKSVIGANFEIVDIDKARVTKNDQNERNFQIFYMLKHFSDEIIDQLPFFQEKFKYLNLEPKNTFVSFKRSQKVLNAFKELGLNEEFSIIIRILFAILCIGNIEYKENANITKETQKFVGFISKLLSITEETLIKTLKTKQIKIGKTVVVSELDKSDCITQSNVFVQFLYQKV